MKYVFRNSCLSVCKICAKKIHAKSGVQNCHFLCKSRLKNADSYCKRSTFGIHQKIFRCNDCSDQFLTVKAKINHGKECHPVTYNHLKVSFRMRKQFLTILMNFYFFRIQKPPTLLVHQL